MRAERIPRHEAAPPSVACDVISHRVTRGRRFHVAAADDVVSMQHGRATLRCWGYSREVLHRVFVVGATRSLCRGRRVLVQSVFRCLCA
ncbi:hypothetical protein LSAT2_012672 [Lamellibrachia satsuma]|nr:hypothetical protein LSAT2_012672 [Lamellibrachia satsuma]